MKLTLPAGAPKDLIYPVGVVAPGQGFDLLGGGYRVIRRQRFTTLASIGVGAILIAFLGVQTISAFVTTNISQSSNNSTKAALALAAAQVNKKLPGGISDAQLGLHTKERATVATLALEQSFDANAVITQILAAAPAGLTITQIQVEPVIADQPQIGARATVPVAATVTPRLADFQITVTASFTSKSQVATWFSAVSQLTFLSSASSSNDEKSVRTTAHLVGLDPASLADFRTTWSSALPKDGVVPAPVIAKAAAK